MKTLVAFFALLSLLITPAIASPILNVDRLGESLGGWRSKGNRAADYERSGSKYRTWKPEVTAMMDGGLFISMRIDHMRGLFAADDHASLQITIDKNGNVVSAQSSLAFQGKKITSDAIRQTADAGNQVSGIPQVTKIGTDLLADLSSKVLRENVAEPGRVTFPAVIHHNYNLLCHATGLINEKSLNAATITEAASEPEKKKKTPAQSGLKIDGQGGLTGKPLPIGQ